MIQTCRLGILSYILLLSQASFSQITPEWLEKLDSQVVGKEYIYSETYEDESGKASSSHHLRVYSLERGYEEYVLQPRSLKSRVYYEAPHAAAIKENGYVILNNHYNEYDDPASVWHGMNALPNVVLGRGFSKLQDLVIKRSGSLISVSGKDKDGSIITGFFDPKNLNFPQRVERHFPDSEIKNMWRYSGKITTKDGMSYPKSISMTIINGGPALDRVEKRFEFQEIKPLTSTYTDGWFDPKYTYREKRVNPSIAWEYEEILDAAGPDVTLEELLALSQGKLDKINQRVSQFEKSKGNSFFSNPLYITLILLGAALVLMGKKLFSKAASRQ